MLLVATIESSGVLPIDRLLHLEPQLQISLLFFYEHVERLVTLLEQIICLVDINIFFVLPLPTLWGEEIVLCRRVYKMVNPVIHLNLAIYEFLLWV